MAGEQYRFPRNYRLTKTDDFSSVFGFRKAVKGNFFMLHFGPPSDAPARLGVVVGKKLLKQAVRRNAVKRITREVFRLQHGHLPNRSVIVRLTRKFEGMPRKAIAEELLYLLQKLCQQDQRSAGGKHA